MNSYVDKKYDTNSINIQLTFNQLKLQLWIFLDILKSLITGY